MPTIKIYDIPILVDLTLLDNGVDNNNMPFHKSDFKVYRGSHNPIEFIVRDNDRKPVDLTTKSLLMTIINFYSGETIVQKDAVIVDALKGRISVIFDPTETDDWEVGTYKYSILITNSDTTTNLLAIDQDSNVAGFFEFMDGVLPGLIESEVQLGTEFVSTETYPSIYVSSAFMGDASFGTNDGLHTVAVYVTDYAGKFWVEGSLEESPTSLDGDWFVINLTSFFDYHEFGNTPLADDTFTGIEAFNFTGSIKWVRFKHQPDIDNPGTLDQVLFRS